MGWLLVASPIPIVRDVTQHKELCILEIGGVLTSLSPSQFHPVSVLIPSS